ncbi:MAG: hypothetical protein KIS65_04490 [Nitrosomonas sp.]|nr:hypothetical protein [Nitrosomonas sp.]
MDLEHCQIFWRRVVDMNDRALRQNRDRIGWKAERRTA